MEGVDGRIILKWIFEKRNGERGDMEWIDLAQNLDGWRAIVNAVINLLFPKIRGISWVAEDLLASQEGL